MPIFEDHFKERLAAAINDLITTNFPALVQVLYRFDISEPKLKEMLASNPNSSAGLIIAELLIEREAKKVKTRRDFKRDENIPDDEKW